MATGGDRAKVEFAKELAGITDPKLRDFVLTCFDQLCPESFWYRECAKATKGKPQRHPDLAQGQGGLVRHVRYGCWWGEEMCRALGEEYLDIVRSALLLHDCMKDGDPTLAHRPERQGWPGRKMILGCHGVDMAQAIYNRVLNKSPDHAQTLVCYGIAGHMGIWTLPVEYIPANMKGTEARRIAQIVSISDYAASRRADAEMATYPPQNGEQIQPPIA